MNRHLNSSATQGRVFEVAVNQYPMLFSFTFRANQSSMGVAGRICRYTVAFIAIILLVCFVRTAVKLSLQSKKLAICQRNETDGFIEVTNGRWQKFRDALRFKTISYHKDVLEGAEMIKLVEYILKEHPAIFRSKHVQHEIVNKHSLLVHVRGTNSTLTPYMLAAHLDVVPVVADEWSVDPFGAVENDDGTLVYGRGAIDCKGTLMAILGALEYMFERGLTPERSFYLAFGHDEEVMGEHGAQEIAETLRRRGVENLHFLLDEGMVVARDSLPGISIPVAGIGVTEKGFLTLNISVSVPGGHSSMPPKESAIGILAKAVKRLETNPMPGKIDSIISESLESLAPEFKFPFNVLMTNLWLFRPFWAWALSKHQMVQGFVRSTTAVTIIRGGMKSNVIPSTAWAVVNHRVHPMNTIEEMIQYDKDVIDDDRVKINVTTSHGAHPISPFDRANSLPYQILTDTIDQIFDDSVICPVPLVANTDTKWYLGFTKHVYRFFPYVLGPLDIRSIHAADERLSKANYGKAMNFYYHLIQNADRPELRSLTDFKEEL